MNKKITLVFDNSSTMYWWKAVFEETVTHYQGLGFDVATLNSDEMGLADKSKPLVLFSDCVSHEFGQFLKQLEIHSTGALVCLINPVWIDGSALDCAFKSRIYPTGNGNERNDSLTIFDWDKNDVTSKGLVLPCDTSDNINRLAYLMGADFESLYLSNSDRDYVYCNCLVFEKHDVFIKKCSEHLAKQSDNKYNTAEHQVASFYERYQRRFDFFDERYLIRFDFFDFVKFLSSQKLKDFNVETITEYAHSDVYKHYYDTPCRLARMLSEFLLNSGLVYISKMDLSNPANTGYSFYDGVIDEILSSSYYNNRKKSMLRLVFSLQGHKGWYYKNSEECYYLAKILDDGINDAQQLLDTNKHLCDKDFALVVSKSPLSKVLFSARKNDTDIRTEWLKLEFVIAKKLLFVLLRENPVKYKKYLNLVH